MDSGSLRASKPFKALGGEAREVGRLPSALGAQVTLSLPDSPTTTPETAVAVAALKNVQASVVRHKDCRVRRDRVPSGLAALTSRPSPLLRCAETVDRVHTVSGRQVYTPRVNALEPSDREILEQTDPGS